MNIQQAKDQIKNAITAYFTKDELGNYIIPIERQRPIFLMGPPGIGKTAIMEQIAQELSVGLVSYSMTHHTRQSALGLPFIVKKNYGGEDYDISEYTMSEIIASVYDVMEESGVSEGILFLDEINCVSETLAPAMLQFLQYKIFGKHKAPKGWIVVTAGNPPEYNKSVREFDIVTWDRLKRVDVEPDYKVWKEYAYLKNVHPAILTYLDIKTLDFYSVETTINGKSFVTARGWDDLSTMIHIYEKKGIKVDELLVSQYLQNKKIAKNFAIYYDLFNKYKSDYQIDTILAGKASEEITNRAVNAKFDERLSLIGLLLGAVSQSVIDVELNDNVNRELLTQLQAVNAELSKNKMSPREVLLSRIGVINEIIRKDKSAGKLSADRHRELLKVSREIEKLAAVIAGESDGKAAFDIIKKDFSAKIQADKKLPSKTGEKLENMFDFCEKTFGDGQELLIIVTELTANSHTAKFISRYGCPAYFRHNKELLFYERSKDIAIELESLDVDNL